MQWLKINNIIFKCNWLIINYKLWWNYDKIRKCKCLPNSNSVTLKINQPIILIKTSELSKK